jgi:hypothetical protein
VHFLARSRQAKQNRERIALTALLFEIHMEHRQLRKSTSPVSTLGMGEFGGRCDLFIRFFVLLALVVLPLCAPLRAANEVESLVGTWRVERIIDTDVAGKVSYPYGEHPKGYVVYDSIGHVHVQVMRTPAAKPFASGDDAKGTNDEVRAAYQGYAAYFGTYRVDLKKGLVVHQVEGSLMPSYTGTDQPRPFRIDHDVLTIEGNDSTGVHFLRQLRRVH